MTVAITHEQTVFGTTRIIDDQIGRVGVADQIVDIDLAGLNELLRQGHHQQPVGPRGDRKPFVGDRGISGTHRIDGYELRASCF